MVAKIASLFITALPSGVLPRGLVTVRWRGHLSTSKAEVEISIVRADALSFPADVLILKHAQALYGVDAQVVSRLDGNRGQVFAPVPLPPVGSVNLVDSRGL